MLYSIHLNRYTKVWYRNTKICCKNIPIWNPYQTTNVKYSYIYISSKESFEKPRLCNTHTLGNTDYGNAEHKFSRRHGNEKIWVSWCIQTALK